MRRASIILCSALAVVALSALPVAASEFAHRAARADEPRDPVAPCVIILLGSPTRDDGAPSEAQARRSAAALEAWATLGCSHIIATGGAVRNDHVEADTLAHLLARQGVPPAALFRERAARDTRENIARSIQLMADRTANIVVVSNPLHARRALRYLRADHPDTAAAAFAFSGATDRSGWRERLAVSTYELAAWIRDVASQP
jgi:uncharacterized SAM-binding protein YcdF (DUF218 family)